MPGATELATAAITRSVPVEKTARVLQVSGLFDVPPLDRSELRWDVRLPLHERPWAIGLIVGPSGCGKTTIARALWPESLARTFDWPESRSVLDGFPAPMSVKAIVELLSSVGFSSPPSWLRPYHVLSQGEQFRVTLARLLAEDDELVVFDEYSSVVDRTVAQIGSAALARTVRRRGQHFIAATCHEDVLDWLQPDWVYSPAANLFSWRSLQRRPEVQLTVARVTHQAWRLFGQHHYLDQRINPSAYCFVAEWRGVPVAFCAALSFPHATRPGWRLHRLVCLPDYQGVGIGSALADYIAAAFKSTGKPVFRTASHPAVVSHCARSPLWSLRRQPSRTSRYKGKPDFNATAASHRLTAGFEYVGPALDTGEAECVLHRG